MLVVKTLDTGWTAECMYKPTVKVFPDPWNVRQLQGELSGKFERPRISPFERVSWFIIGFKFRESNG
jgi:hypothetical protein